MRRHRFWHGAALVLLWTASARADGPILHEPLGADRPSAAASSSNVSDEPGTTANGQSGQPGQNEPSDQGPDPLARQSGVDTDRATGPEPPGPHPYYEVFDPAVYPWKRMSAFDHVELGACSPARMGCRRERLVTTAGTLTTLRAHSAVAASSDIFVGRVQARLSPTWSALPAPGAPLALVSYATTPTARLQFAVDATDNLWVRTEHGSGTYEVLYRVAVPAGYFGGALPTARLSDEPAIAPVPAETQARALRVWRALGVDNNRTQPLAPLITKLVDWFRGFAVGDPPAEVEGDFVDLALARRGSCRHRSFAFTVTALSLGIPARMIQNELHVYVEVYLPTSGWRRIDLGGALLDPVVIDEAHRPPHQPRGADPFAPAKPPAGVEANNGNHTQGYGSNGSTGSTGSGGSNGSGTRREAPSGGSPASTTGTALPSTVANRGKLVTTIDVATAQTDLFAGDSTRVHGTLRVAHGSAAGLPVEIWLDGAQPIRVGQATSAEDGSFVVEVQVPADLPPATYRLMARTLGDEQRASAVSK